MSDDEGAGMTTPEMVIRYRFLVDRSATLSHAVGALNAKIKALTAERERMAAEDRESVRERRELTALYAEQTNGLNIKKAARCPEDAELQRAHAVLLHALGEPCYLAPGDPIVISRLSDYQRALVAAKAAREARTPELDAEVTRLLESSP